MIKIHFVCTVSYLFFISDHHLLVREDWLETAMKNYSMWVVSSWQSLDCLSGGAGNSGGCCWCLLLCFSSECTCIILDNGCSSVPSVFLSTSKFIFRGCHVHDRIVVGFKVPITTKVMSSNPVHDEVLHDKVCQWLATGQWFSPGTPVSSTNKTDRHDIAEILLKVVLNTINQTINRKFIHSNNNMTFHYKILNFNFCIHSWKINQSEHCIQYIQYN